MYRIVYLYFPFLLKLHVCFFLFKSCTQSTNKDIYINVNIVDPAVSVHAFVYWCIDLFISDCWMSGPTGPLVLWATDLDHNSWEKCHPAQCDLYPPYPGSLGKESGKADLFVPMAHWSSAIWNINISTDDTCTTKKKIWWVIAINLWSYN